MPCLIVCVKTDGSIKVRPPYLPYSFEKERQPLTREKLRAFPQVVNLMSVRVM
jgi:hypothetical protein